MALLGEVQRLFARLEPLVASLDEEREVRAAAVADPPRELGVAGESPDRRGEGGTT